MLEAQPLHAPPLFPHALTPVPTTHTPPVQQPPLHGWVAALHCIVQRCVAVSHAVPSAQSAAELHPQNVEPPLVTHCPPFALDAQLVHAGAEPVTAHAALVLPGAQVPALQQPPLQARFPAHDVEQVCEAGSHAWPTRQSVALLQPPPLSPPPLSPPPPASPSGPASTGAASAPVSAGGW